MNKEKKTTDTTPKLLGQTLTSYTPGHSQSVPSLAASVWADALERNLVQHLEIINNELHSKWLQGYQSLST